jgi:hypothetical protein
MKRILLPCLFFLALISCKKDTNQDEVATAASPSAAIHSSLEQFEVCATAMHNGELGDFALELIDENASDNVDDEYISDLLDILTEQYFDGIEFYENNRVNQSLYEGTYTFNGSSFIKTESTGVFIVNMPSTHTSGNNLVLTINNYNETNTQVDGETFYLPNSLDAEVTFNGTMLASLHVSNVFFDNSGSTNLPTSANISLFSAPFTHTLNVSRTDAMHYNVTYNLENNGACTYNLAVSGISNTATYEEFEMNENLETISGSLEMGTVTYKFNANIKALNTDDVSASDANKHISIDVFSNGNKVGEVLFSDDDNSVYIVSAVGDQTALEDIVQPHLDDLEAIFSDFE